MKNVYMVPRPGTPVSGAVKNEYFYETVVDGHPWLAEIEEDIMFEPDDFVIDEDPVGRGFRTAAEAVEWLESEAYNKGQAQIVGYIEKNELFITKRIKVETGWSGSFPMLCTSWEFIKPNVGPKK